MARKLERGKYIMTDIVSGKALDMRHDNQMLHAYPLHGENNQQARLITLLTLSEGRADWSFFLLSDVVMTVRRRTRALHCVQLHTTHIIVCYYFACQWEFCPCGTGFTIKSVRVKSLFLAVRDFSKLQLEGSTRVVTGSLPMCWDVEILPVGTAGTEPDGGFARYVSLRP